jgi:hypothetical protein
VRLVFHADPEGHLRVTVTSAGEVRSAAGDERAVAKARAVVSALGGRLEGDRPGEGVTILLPQR